MNEPSPTPDAHADDALAMGDSTDERMVRVLTGTSSGANLRKELQNDDSDEAADLLARLNALDFVQQVVGDELELPDHIGSYQVRGLLGRGGMGTVYLGWQSELEREVALKVLSSSYASDPTMRKRFRAEARATAALHHRHIVPIYDYGEAQGMLFFAMERVDGMSLDRHISAARRVDKPSLEMLDAARRFAGVADALGLAHRRRLLHRDVKPGNILVAGDGTLALTDFGLAKALDHASMHLTSKGGGFLGTLHYASPEQALGTELTPASDLYSLGVTIFEAVTGHLPRSGKTTEALLQSILHGTPRRLRDFVTKPPRDFEAVLEKLLSREPGDRYQDGEELSRDLLRIADGEPVHIRRLPIHVRLWRRARKNPVLTGALAAIFMLMLATMTLVGVLNREKGNSRVSRHQNNLAGISVAVGAERGSPWGPLPLFYALTGVEVEVVPPCAPILDTMDTVQATMPGDTQVAAMREAYCEDPVPRASALLREGRGFEALRLYDLAINQAITGRSRADLAPELRLYGLYLGRAVAKLTASVARPYDARTDLALASYLRPGAAFPIVLLDVLGVVQSADVRAAAERLEREVLMAEPERVRTLALLLWSAAGLRPRTASNMMEFPLGFERRRLLHDMAARLLHEEVGACLCQEQPTGLSAVFAEACRQALDQSDKPTAMRDLVEQTSKAIGTAVDPESPLQGWRYLLQLLVQARQRGPLLGQDQLPVPPAMQLAAWRSLLLLQPSPGLADLWRSRFDDLHLNNPGLPGIVPVAAQLHTIANSPEAERWADRWIVMGEGDPAARLCRMRVLLRQGRLDEARDDAMVAVQHSATPQETLQDIVRICSVEASSLESGAIEGVRLMAQQFRSLLAVGAPRVGGGR